MKIQAAVARQKGAPYVVESLTLEPPRDNEVLVRISGVGVCHTDTKVRDGMRPIPYPIVLGHEGSGVVVSVGRQVGHVRPGDHVVLTFNSCGHCPNCTAGNPAYCQHVFSLSFGGQRLDGSTPLSQNGQRIAGHFFGQSSFATYALATERNVVKVRRDVPLELLGPLGCAIQTGAGAVLNALQAGPGTSIVLFGVGSVGLSAVMAAAIAECRMIIAVDRIPARLALARELGATHVFNADDTDDIVGVIRELSDGGVDYSLDTTSNPVVFRQAIDCLAILGECGLIGGADADTEVCLKMNHLLPGRVVRGILQGDSVPQQFIPRLIDEYVHGRFPFDRLITFYALDEINQASADMESGRVIKPVLRMEPSSTVDAEVKNE